MNDLQEWRNLSESAKYLGLNVSTLCELGQDGGLYEPSVSGIPREGESTIRGVKFGARHIRYHIIHLDIIKAVLMRSMALKDGVKMWKQKKMGLLRNLVHAVNSAPTAKPRQRRSKTNGTRAKRT